MCYRTNNRTDDTSISNNYKPIALVTAMSKIFELCILTIFELFLTTTDNQFDFKTTLHGYMYFCD